MNRHPVDYKQRDKRWGSELYSSHNDSCQTIASSGSAPTLCADIVATLKDPAVTPPILARQALEWGCRTRMSGTAWDFFKKVAEYYQFRKFVQSGKWEALIKCLNAGGYAVCMMRPGYWCKGGNYILAWKYDDKYVYAVDAWTKTKNKQLISDFVKESKMYFCFYPDADN
jgi:hypothetical protein